MKAKMLVSNKRKVLQYLLITVLMSISFELMYLVVFPNRPKISMPDFGYSYDWLWELSALIGIGYILFSLNVKIYQYLIFSCLSVLISTQLIRIIPDKLKIEGLYYGISWQNSSRGDHFLNGHLYCSQSKLEKSSLITVGKENNYVIERRNFLFWQTGVAYGFEPDLEIEVFNWPVEFLNKFLLFLIVGPVALIEVIIKGVYSNFLILVLIQLVYFIKFNKTIFN